MFNPLVILPMGMIIKSLCSKHTCEAGKHLLAHFKKINSKKMFVVLCAPFLFLEGTGR